MAWEAQKRQLGFNLIAIALPLQKVSALLTFAVLNPGVQFDAW
jgi:hypothetical protein